MLEFDMSVLFLVALSLSLVCGLTYNGVWVQDQGMIQVADAMHTYLALSTMDLFMNAVAVGSSTKASNLDVAIFTGYAAQTYTTTPAAVNDPVAGGYSIYLPSHVFTCTTAPGSPVTIYGCYLKDAGGGLIAAANFATPITIVNVGDSVPLQVTLNFTAGGLQMFANILS